jgi:hypothetical protein
MAGVALVTPALSYADLGWQCFPLRGKVPLTSNGLHAATTDRTQLEEWFASGANVGIRTGAESGLVVLDVDEEPGGHDTLAALEQDYGKLPATVESITGGGGRHIFFTHPGQPVRNAQGKLGPGLDVRGDGGYVVAPPSTHDSGRRYEWEFPPEEVELAAMPEWLLTLLLERPERNGAAPVGEEIPKGKRDGTLTSLAGTMRRRGMDEEEIRVALMATNARRCKPPLPESDIERIAHSVAQYAPERTEEPLELEVLTARQVCELPPPAEADELLGRLLIRGQRLVAGAHTGEGKTTLGLQLVRSVTLQEDFLGYFGTGGRALVIDAEQGLRTIQRRLLEARLSNSEHVDYIRVPDGLDLADDLQAQALEDVIAAGGYVLVLADPLYKLHRGQSNDEREAVDLMRRFDAWREKYRFALVIPVHTRKPPPGSRFSIHELFGSSAYVRGAEVVLGLERVRDGYSRLHFFKDRDGDLPIGAKWGLLFDRDQGFRRDPDDDKPKETAAEQVERLLLDDPGMTLEALVKATGKSERTIRAALKQVGAEAIGHPKRWLMPAEEDGSG